MHQTPQPKDPEQMAMGNDDVVVDILDADKTNHKIKENRNIIKSTVSIFRCISLMVYTKYTKNTKYTEYPFLETRGRIEKPSCSTL